jgi:two-component system phosphate regulon sensor histidine kinase PhoR
VAKPSKSLSGRIFSTVLIFSLLVVLVLAIALSSVFYLNYEDDAAAELEMRAQEVASYMNAVPEDEAVSFLEKNVEGDTRYTLIDNDGTVLYDNWSDVSTMDNHASRPEVLSATETGLGSSSRYSDTIQTDTLYAAVRLDNGNIVRLAETRHSLVVFMGNMFIPVLFILAVVVIAVAILSRVLTRRILRPMNALDLSHPLDNDIYVEMEPLLERVDNQQVMLREQNAKLAQAENVRRDFSSNVSHEMKTPLQVISGYAEIMQNGDIPPEEVKKFSALIYEESLTMRALIDDLLTLSRLDEPSFSFENTEIDVYSVARRVSARIQVFAEERHVAVYVQGIPAYIRGSGTLIEEMIYNLMENGIRYNHCDGNVQVWISVVQNDAETKKKYGSDTCVCIRTTDTGPGIPPEMRDKIFQRFFRIEQSRSKETGGTGLGLAIVKHAVQYHHGTIEVLGEEGEGTTFVVMLPAIDPPIQPPIVMYSDFED